VTLPFLAALTLATSALLMERLIRLLDLFANRGGPIYLILKMLGFLVPHYLALGIPAAFFIAVLYVTMRLSHDSELDAFRASGISLLRIAVPIIALGMVLTILTGAIIGSLQPYTRYAYRALAYIVGETSWNAAIERGAFFSGFGGKTMLIGDISKGGRELRQIFIEEVDNEGRNIAISAPSGALAIDPNDYSLKLVLHDGMRIRSSGNGEPGPNGGPPGDLYIEIRIKQHEIFERDGDDLHCTVPVPLTLAALGGGITVPTLAGKAEIDLPEGTQHGKTFRLRGKGIKGIRSSYPGDLYCHITVETPVRLTEHQRKLMKELDESFKKGGDRHSPNSKSWTDRVKDLFK